MKRQRSIRQQTSDNGAGAGGMTQQDRDAVRTYRTNRGSQVYYRDLKVIDDKPLPAPEPADKSEQ